MAGFTATLLAATAAAGTAMTAYGQYKAGKDAQEAADFNADIYKLQAKNIDVKKAMTAQEYDRMIKQLQGKSVTAIASSGYDFSGSFLEVMKDSITQARLDKAKELYNLNMEKKMALSSAEREKETGVSAYQTGLLQAGGTILTEGNDWYMKYGGFASAK